MDMMIELTDIKHSCIPDFLMNMEPIETMYFQTNQSIISGSITYSGQNEGFPTRRGPQTIGKLVCKYMLQCLRITWISDSISLQLAENRPSRWRPQMVWYGFTWFHMASHTRM